jgi:hypothetical protein
MIGERTHEGWQLRLRPPGFERAFGSAFMLVWLCGWALGEFFALWLLVRGAIALVTGAPPDPGREPLAPGPAIAAGVFLLAWLAIWTLGGIAAISELLRMMWGEDRLTIQGGRLIVEHIRGPFRSTREFTRDGIRRIVLLPRLDRLALETERESVELSTLGTRNQRVQAADEMIAELRLAPVDPAASAALPVGWEAVISHEGERVLVPNLETRARQARAASVVTLLAAAVALLVGREAVRDPSLWILTGLAVAASIALTAGTLWLARGRMEWRVGNGRLTLRRRYGEDASDVFEAGRLVLDVTSDSDGDEWFELAAVREPEGASPPAGTPMPRVSGKHRRSIARVMNDAAVPRQLGAWLAQSAGIPIEDRSTPEARAAEISELRKQLERSGRFGRLAGRWLDRVSEGRRKTG